LWKTFQRAVIEDGRMVASMHRKATSSSNKYIDQDIYWVFSNAEEIDELLSLLDIEKIEGIAKEKSNKNDLFR